MKKSIVILVLLFYFSFYVVAQEDFGPDIGEDDANKLLNITDNIPIDEDSGDVDWGKLNGTITKAEERIDKINFWLEENTSWLEIVLGMVPEISWKFAWNFYFMLLFLVVFVLNGSFMFSFFGENRQRIIGLAVYIILLVMKVYVSLASFAMALMVLLWNLFLSLSLIAAIIFAILVIVTDGAILVYIPRVLYWLQEFLKVRKEAKAAKETDLNRQVLGKVVEGIIKAH